MLRALVFDVTPLFARVRLERVDEALAVSRVRDNRRSGSMWRIRKTEMTVRSSGCSPDRGETVGARKIFSIRRAGSRLGYDLGS
jgi:hypothetical protein